MRSAWLHITFRKWQKILINFSSDLRFKPKKSEKNGIRIQIFECLKICIEFMKFSCDFFMLHVKTFFHFSLHSTAEGNLNFWARFYSSKKKFKFLLNIFLSTMWHQFLQEIILIMTYVHMLARSVPFQFQEKYFLCSNIWRCSYQSIIVLYICKCSVIATNME